MEGSIEEINAIPLVDVMRVLLAIVLMGTEGKVLIETVIGSQGASSVSKWCKAPAVRSWTTTPWPC